MLLTACQAPLSPVTAPSSVSQEGLTLRVRPVVSNGLAVPSSSTPLTDFTVNKHVGGMVRPPDDQLLVALSDGNIWKFDPVTKTRTVFRSSTGFSWSMVRDARGLHYLSSDGMLRVF